MLNNQKTQLSEIFAQNYQYHYVDGRNYVSGLIAINQDENNFIIYEVVNHEDCYAFHDYTVKDLEEYVTKYDFLEKEIKTQLLDAIALWYQLVLHYEKEANKHELQISMW